MLLRSATRVRVCTTGEAQLPDNLPDPWCVGPADPDFGSVLQGCYETSFAIAGKVFDSVAGNDMRPMYAHELGGIQPLLKCIQTEVAQMGVPRRVQQ